MRYVRQAVALTMACVGSLAPAAPPVVAPTATDYDSPCAIAASPDGSTLYVACSTTRQIAVVDTASTRVMQRVDLPAPPTGCAVTRDAARLYVACAAPRSHVLVIDLDCGAVLDGIMVGHTAMAPVLSADERRLYVCNRFENSVSVLDLTTGTEIERVPVSREPVAAALTSDGRHLLVANHLHNAVTDGPGVAAVVSVIDTTSLRLVRQIQLARGSGLLRGIAVSPDGRYAAVTHLLARYYLPTTEVDFGRINSNALSLIDLERMEYLRNVFLDQARHGAGNPWAVAWTADSSRMVVTLAGTHELCLIDAPLRPQQPVAAGKRIPLRGNGPRSLAVVGHHAYIANYFSDDLAVVDLDAADVEPSRIELSPPSEMSRVRQGEMWFNDATLCYQQWQSCASCHDSDGRMDAMNWDLLNDGIGNPKNAKSLLWAHRTPPAMALGVRTSAEIAVRAGIRHILFAEQPEEVASAIDEYLKSLEPIPSPHQVNNEFSEAAQRGRQLFNHPEVGCADCHSPPLFTDLAAADVGTRGRYDRPEDPAPFDTPTLVELWRTAPYLHDGSAPTIRDVLLRLNPHDRHGRTSQLSPHQIEDLEAYLLSL